MIILHGVMLVGWIAAAIALTTWRGGLYPFDLFFSALITGGGLALLVLAWGPVWLVPLGLSFALDRPWQRLAVWPLVVMAMIALHAVFGPARGFAPLASLGLVSAVFLYTPPVALALLIGSALREAFRRKSSPAQIEDLGSDAAQRAAPTS